MAVMEMIIMRCKIYFGCHYQSINICGLLNQEYFGKDRWVFRWGNRKRPAGIPASLLSGPEGI